MSSVRDAPLRPEPRSGRASGQEPGRGPTDPTAHRAWQVAAENRLASSSISAGDARWVLAVRAADAVEGGRAAVLGAEARERLLHTARGLGLRPFDANLVLAIVQDAARQGRTPRDPETAERLSLVGSAEQPLRRALGLWTVLLLACSAVWAAALVWWLTA